MSALVRVSTAVAQHQEQKKPREERLVSFHITPSLREEVRQELKAGPGKAEPME